MGGRVCDLPVDPGCAGPAAAHPGRRYRPRRRARPGIWADRHTLLAHEYRAMQKLYRLTKKRVNGQRLEGGEEHSWRERYCLDLRSRVLHGPEDYIGVDPEYRLWIWGPRDAVGRLNLTPAPKLVAAD